MWNLSRCFCFFVVLLAVVSFEADAKTEGPIAGYVHTGWTQADGAPAEVWSIVQDDDGWLWLSSPSGLYRFDGDRFEHITEIAGHKLHKSDIVGLAWIDGALWLGYQFGGVERFVFRDGTSTYFDHSSGLTEATVYQFARGPDGMVSAGTMSGLYDWHGHDWKRVWPVAGEKTEPAWRLLRNIDGSLLMQVGTSRILRRAAGATSFVKVDSDDENTVGLIRGRNGGFWAAGGHYGFLEYDPMAKRLRRGIPTHLTDHADDLIFLRDGSTWMVTGQSVRLLVDTKSFRMVDELTRARGLSDGTVLTNFEDREGNLWLGTNSGVDRIRRSKVHQFALPYDVRDPGIAPGDDNTMWIGSRQGAPLRQYGPDGIVHTTTLTWAENVIRGPDGTIWAANAKRLDRYAHGEEESWTLPQQQQVQTAAQDRDGSLWVSILGSKELFHFHDGVWETGTARLGFAGLPVLLTTDDHNRLWQGYTDNRVAVADDNAVIRYTAKQGLRLGNVQSFAMRDGHVWVGGEQALMFLQKGRFSTLFGADGSDFLGVSGIVETTNGDLWLNGLQGVTHIAAHDLKRALESNVKRVAFERFNYQDGVVGQSPHIRPLPSLLQGPDGRIWYATNSTVGWIDPAHIPRNNVPPPVRLRALFADGIAFPPSSAALNLAQHNKNLRIDYTALSLSMPERMRFRYRLVGVDTEWIDAGPRRSAYYTVLKSGSYHFQVQAANEDGVWNREGAVQDFTIAPTLAETAWFKVLCGLALIGLVWLAFRWRLARLSAQIRLRMNERIDERTRIARELHDTLLQSVQALVLKVHGASRRLSAHESVRDLLDDALTQAETTIIEGRNRVLDLRTQEDGTDLLSRLAEFGNANAQNSVTRFAMNVENQQRPLTSGIEIDLLAICREAISNAFQHAQASHVIVTVHFEPKALVIVVADDGMGIPKEISASGSRSGHFGLVGMRERAKKVGATLAVARRGGGGTEYVLTLESSLAYSVESTHWWDSILAIIRGNASDVRSR